MGGIKMSANGISNYGAYLPSWKLTTTKFGAESFKLNSKQSRSVSYFDEDTVTMSVEASCCLKFQDSESCEVNVATATPTYLDKSPAASICEVIGAPSHTRAIDFHGLRSGASGLWNALSNHGISISADVRVSAPGSADELAVGDGSAMFDCRGDEFIASLLSSSSRTEEFLDRWRLPGESFISSWDDRFSIDIYVELITQVATDALAIAKLESTTRTVVSCPNPRAAALARKLLKSSGEDGELEKLIGFTGSAHLGLLICDALDQSEPGDTILAINAADGADAFVFEVTGHIKNKKQSLTVRQQAQTQHPIAYERYLRWRSLIDLRGPRRPEPDAPAAPPMWRRADWKYGLVASRCLKCETVCAPPARVCSNCGSIDTFVQHSMKDLGGTVASMTVDFLQPTLDPPMILAVIDVNGGGRRSAEVTDNPSGEIQVGEKLQPSFRKIHSSNGIHNYFWKVRPERTEGESHG